MCFLAKKRFVLSLVVLVDTTRASPFLRGIFSPTERSLFLFRVLGTKRLCDGSSCHRVFCENQKSSTRIERKEGSSSSFSSSFFVACADGKTNTTYSLFELEEHFMLEAEILQLTFCGGSLRTYVLIYILRATND